MKYAMQQAFKTMMGQMGPQTNQFDKAGFSPGSPYPFSMPSTTLGSASPSTYSPAASQSPSSVNIPTTEVESATKEEAEPTSRMKDEAEIKTEPKTISFVDISPEETALKSPYESFENVSKNGAASKPSDTAPEEGQSAGKSKDLSVEALEKMMEDPTVQKMVFPYLPDEMRNPATFKWMLQNPQYRQQLEDMLKNMSGSGEWDNRMMDSLTNFDLSSPEVKQQFDQIGLTPEEVISKIMANPDIAMAFQNPRVQAAIMDCSQNPLSTAKYQDNKEVMDVFNKISELFPGATASF